MTTRVELTDLRSLREPEDSQPIFSGAWGAITALAEAVLEVEGFRGAVTLAMVDESTMADLNQRFRGVKSATDVLSFHYEAEEDDWPLVFAEEENNIGEVVLCPAVIERYAREEGIEPGRRLAWSVVHGLLHLAGYDHEQDQGEMAQREEELLSRFEELVAGVTIPPVR